MFKTTLTCVVVNIIMAHSCIVTSYPGDQPESNIKQGLNTRTISIPEKFEDAEYNVEDLFFNIFALISQECNHRQGRSSSLLNYSAESMLNRLITLYGPYLAEIQIPKVGFNYTFLDETSYLEIKLRNIYLRHLDTLSIIRFVYDVCKLSNEIGLVLPKLEIAASYTLEGEINHFPVTGDGDFTLNGSWMNFYEESYINNCQSDIFTGKDCNLAYMNVTANVEMQLLEVTVSGVNYRDLSDYEVSQKLNYYIREYLNSDKTELKRKMADEIYKNMIDVLNLMILDP